MERECRESAAATGLASSTNFDQFPQLEQPRPRRRPGPRLERRRRPCLRPTSRPYMRWRCSVARNKVRSGCCESSRPTRPSRCRNRRGSAAFLRKRTCSSWCGKPFPPTSWRTWFCLPPCGGEDRLLHQCRPNGPHLPQGGGAAGRLGRIWHLLGRGGPPVWAVFQNVKCRIRGKSKARADRPKWGCTVSRRKGPGRARRDSAGVLQIRIEAAMPNSAQTLRLVAVLLAPQSVRLQLGPQRVAVDSQDARRLVQVSMRAPQQMNQ